MSKGKKQTLIITGIVLLTAVAAIACYFIFHKKDDPGLLYDNNATAGILPGVDIDSRRKELQEMLLNR